MTIPPAFAALLIPALLLAIWIYLHKDADIEQRIDAREAQHQIESAAFDKDFSRMTGDKDGEKLASERLEESKSMLKKAQESRENRKNTDQRPELRDNVDNILKPEIQNLNRK